MKSVRKVAEGDGSANPALEIMRGWKWGWQDYGELLDWAKPLNLVVNQLAMEGQARPQVAVLELLCQGDLIARGDVHWRKYEGGPKFSLNGTASTIVPQQWVRLARIIDEERHQLADGHRPLEHVDLPHLGLVTCPTYEWAFAENRFSTAACSTGWLKEGNDDTEELFSASEIEVWPKFIFEPSHDGNSTPAPNSINTGGRPSAADWEGAALELAGRYYRGDFKPENISAVMRELADFLTTENGHPAESTLRPHAKRIFSALKAWDDE